MPILDMLQIMAADIIVEFTHAGLKAWSLAMQMQQGRAAFANDEQIALGIEVEPLSLKTDVTGQLGELGVADRDEAPGAWCHAMR